MFMFLWIFKIVILSSIARAVQAVTVDPEPPPSNITTCEEFERGARFNPYLVIESMWKIFYFWSHTSEIYPIIFALPTKNRLVKFLQEVQGVDPHMRLDWGKATLFMTPRAGTEVLFLYQGTPGAFRAVIKQEQRNKARPHPPPLIKLSDVRMKLTDNIMGMMCCEDFTAYALAKVEAMPETEELCVLKASRIGYRGPNGRSYITLKRMFEDEL